MKEIIQQHLATLEKTENIRILFAIESGSRAWGFASPDSDYDVRFIYMRPAAEYLRFDKKRDVIELMLTTELDINGWDLDKALKLLHTSNPTFFEWCNSPIIYRETTFLDKLNAVKDKYFYSKTGLHHYLSMAAGNHRDTQHGEQIKYKKYFYILRPLLACEWILREGTPPPMRFQELCAYLPPDLQNIVNTLLDMKINNPETAHGLKIKEIGNWIEAEIQRLDAKVLQLPGEPKPDWQELNDLFLSEVLRFGV